MINSDIFRGFNDLFILSVLDISDSYGYEIGKKISDLSNHQYVMKEATLYSAFSRLLKEGWIQDYPVTITNGRPRTYYRITPLGKAILKQKKMEWQSIQTVINRVIREG